MIIGGGISGLSSAINLVKGGNKVEIFEQNDFVGKSSGENVQAIRNYDLPKDFLENLKDCSLRLNYTKPITRIKKFAPSGKQMLVSSDDVPLFYAVRRGSATGSIDVQLYEKALEAGVKINFNQRKTLKSGDIIAINSVYKNIWAHGVVFKGVSVDPQTILFFLDNNYCPQGYIYLIPYGKHEVSIAATSFDLNCPLPILFERFLKENEIISKIIEGASFENYFSGYAYANCPVSAEIRDQKFVGSAAGFIDSARGFGIRYAIESGILVAKSINENLNYDALWKQAFEKELLTSLKRRFFLEKLTNEDYEKLIFRDEINIRKYEKIPSSLGGIFEKIEFKMVLNQWRNKFDLNKLFVL